MKKLSAIVLVLTFALCLCVGAMAADTYSVTVINGMDGSEVGTYSVAAGEDFTFTISCAAPCDMGPVADGEEGSGVETTEGTIAYSDITTGGPNAYPTEETVTVSGIAADATVTITPNPDEAEAEFPTVTVGGASGEASGEAGELTATFVTNNAFAGDITVNVTYTVGDDGTITLLSVIDPDLGEDILPVQDEAAVAQIIADLEAAVG